MSENFHDNIIKKSFLVNKTVHSDYFKCCTDCIHSDDSEEICVLRRCIHAIAELKDCYIPKRGGV